MSHFIPATSPLPWASAEAELATSLLCLAPTDISNTPPKKHVIMGFNGPFPAWPCYLFRLPRTQKGGPTARPQPETLAAEATGQQAHLAIQYANNLSLDQSPRPAHPHRNAAAGGQIRLRHDVWLRG